MTFAPDRHRAKGDTGLVHDVGHLRRETDARHGPAGAQWLGQWFGPAVTEPVRLHVAAKRYLFATEPGYLGLLSAESVRTLALQGGPRGHPASVRALRGLAAGSAQAGSAQLLGVRESALTATEFLTLNATAPPR